IIDTSIGSVNLPTYPAILERAEKMSNDFITKSLPYTATEGTNEAKLAFINIAGAMRVDFKGLKIHVTAGGSLAMQYVMLGVCGPKKPLMGFSPLYPNYLSYGERFSIPVVLIQRQLTENGVFSIPEEGEIEAMIEKEKPSALLVIPADNPTGAYFTQDRLNYLAELCVKYGIWMVSDEAYFGLNYVGDKVPSSIWRVTNKQVPGIEGRRIGIHSASKNMNACGLRIGALVTDSDEMAKKAVNCASADLCAGIVDQYLFSALAYESHEDIQKFLAGLRKNYVETMREFRNKLLEFNKDLVVSQPEASIYQVVDFRKVVPDNFKTLEFVNWVAEHGMVMIDGKPMIMIGAPMSGFYRVEKGEKNPGDTQMRVAFVLSKEEMLLGAEVLVKQLELFLGAPLTAIGNKLKTLYNTAIMKKFDQKLLKKLYRPKKDSHKGENGKLLVIGGSELFHSASLWALEVASRIVDMVFYSSVPVNEEIVKKQKERFHDGIVVPEGKLDEYIKEADCVLIGPGMDRSKETEEKTNTLLKKFPQKKWVVDGGALQMMDRSLITKSMILTPHKKEFEGIRPLKLAKNFKSKGYSPLTAINKRVEKVREVSKEYGCTIVLKGEKDIVCDKTECLINQSGNEGMTKGGTGDVLAGLIAGLYCKNDAMLAASAGAYINGLAGDRLYVLAGPYFNASDLMREIPKVMGETVT
ncbi:NAD(P)H-hydrate dehydratase, partial [Patescibacteria group bacterium]|nr:NAD(P)H-hydrate dehydratase [Patescibacteria group bacterium]